MYHITSMKMLLDNSSPTISTGTQNPYRSWVMQHTGYAPYIYKTNPSFCEFIPMSVSSKCLNQ